MTLTSFFVGRRDELKELKSLYDRRTASLMVVKGRRRIGKSRLIREFGRNKSLHVLSGIPVTKETTAQSQREEFARQLAEQFELPGLKADDWGDLFTLLSKQTARGKRIILLDEISWVGSKDADFLGKLKNAWDLHFSQNPQLTLILCGSVSSWIEKNILGSTGFLGRISHVMQLGELSVSESAQLLKLLGNTLSTHEIFKILSVTGGIPRYLEEIQSHYSADEHINRVCFRPEGLLYREFNQIFSDLFSSKSETYKKIVSELVNGARQFEDICKALNVEKSGLVSEYLNDLIQAGFIVRDYTWQLKNHRESSLSHFRLSDNYVRFYLKYIEPNRLRIERGHFKKQSLSSLPGWSSLMGFQFENLVLNNRDFIFDQMNISHEDIIYDNPFFQRKTLRNPGCQIDYLIQTRFNTLFACEIKFSQKEIKFAVIEQMKKKIDNLVKPKEYSCFPVLVHVNGVEESVVDKNYFSKIIDFSELLLDDR